MIAERDNFPHHSLPVVVFGRSRPACIWKNSNQSAINTRAEWNAVPVNDGDNSSSHCRTWNNWHSVSSDTDHPTGCSIAPSDSAIIIGRDPITTSLPGRHNQRLDARTAASRRAGRIFFVASTRGAGGRPFGGIGLPPLAQRDGGHGAAAGKTSYPDAGVFGSGRAGLGFQKDGLRPCIGPADAGECTTVQGHQPAHQFSAPSS